MRSIYIILFSLFVFLQANGQENLYVMATKGTVKANGKVLKAKDKLTISDKVVYSSTEDILYMMSSQRGRLILSASKAKRDGNGELWTMIQNEVVAARGRLSTRQGLPTNDIELISFFACEDEVSEGRFLVIDEGRYLFPKNAFPQTDEDFFYIKYKYNGEVINKQLGHDKETLILNEDIYLVDGKPISKDAVSDMEVCYYFKDANGKHQSKYFIPFNPVFVKGDKLKEEISVMLEQLKKLHSKSAKKNEIIFDEIYTYLNEVYGKPTNTNLETWLKKEFNFSK